VYGEKVASTTSITVKSSPTGAGYVLVDSVGITTPHTYNWNIGDSHNITAYSTVNGVSGQSQYVFGNWSDGLARSHNITVPVSATNYTATFVTQYNVTISLGETDSGYSLTASSGLPSDIQTAVNAVVAAGGGTVFIPSGTFTFNPPTNGVGVTIPYTNVALNIIGAGIGNTILQETTTTTTGASSSHMFVRSWTNKMYAYQYLIQLILE
jgi:hypothetical protein